MPFEIERKFLVANDEWKHEVSRAVRLRDGLIAIRGGRKVRVRIAGDAATLTVKGPRKGIARSEFEYEIPLADAEAMMAEHCRLPGQMVEKTRHFIPNGQLVWEVDVYQGLLSGLTTAEIELPDSGTSFQRPDWLGDEITGDALFSTRILLRQAMARRWSGLFWPAVRRLNLWRRRARPLSRGRATARRS
ncbi:CYTH domain-containing protein [Rhodobacter sp. NSM]|uniref:CYTH domain-containing protein n=1 Tax=Rhodobacter sp. NSM TaxID=3457501 RepID=UPI003FD58F8D